MSPRESVAYFFSNHPFPLPPGKTFRRIRVRDVRGSGSVASLKNHRACIRARFAQRSDFFIFG